MTYALSQETASIGAWTLFEAELCSYMADCGPANRDRFAPVLIRALIPNSTSTKGLLDVLVGELEAPRALSFPE